MRSTAQLGSHHLAFAAPAHDRPPAGASGCTARAGTTSVTGDFSGWKQTEPPFAAFTSRTDGVPRGLSRRTARGGMPCGCRSRWVPATGTGAFARSIR
ncbi:carbohydrate binding domain-containing protein [Streptomyces sp. Tu102]|uniref:carbohydrate binding domain-containing protein n=1 Tax=Streptomyces sp. Tu102 TaxID=2838019 RepID=UPI001BDC7B5A|nr:carbohydrate binding domain-containing protein [Streptomyces sp. Tu102]MBT1097659.1 hypothetical protein [Streptomyces sp. Tu102]